MITMKKVFKNGEYLIEVRDGNNLKGTFEDSEYEDAITFKDILEQQQKEKQNQNFTKNRNALPVTHDVEIMKMNLKKIYGEKIRKRFIVDMLDEEIKALYYTLLRR